MSDLISKARAQAFFWFLILAEALCDVTISISAVTVASLTGVDWETLSKSQHLEILAAGAGLLARDLASMVKKGRQVLSKIEPTLPPPPTGDTGTWKKSPEPPQDAAKP